MGIFMSFELLEITVIGWLIFFLGFLRGIWDTLQIFTKVYVGDPQVYTCL